MYPPQRGPMGVLGGGFRGSKNQKSGKCHKLPRKAIQNYLKKKPGGGGVGWKF